MVLVMRLAQTEMGSCMQKVYKKGREAEGEVGLCVIVTHLNPPYRSSGAGVAFRVVPD